MRLGLVASLALLGAWAALSVTAGDQPWLQPLGGVFGLAIIAFGLVVQFGGRCPRCGMRLAPKVPLEIPGRCPRCRTPFSRAGAG